MAMTGQFQEEDETRVCELDESDPGLIYTSFLGTRSLFHMLGSFDSRPTQLSLFH